MTEDGIGIDHLILQRSINWCVHDGASVHNAAALTAAMGSDQLHLPAQGLHHRSRPATPLEQAHS